MRKIPHYVSILAFVLFTAAQITMVTTLVADTINHNSRHPRSHDLFPQVVRLLTLEKINLDFSGVDFPK